jgi:tetratricopeptide (TPR) repeat protein
VTGTAESPLAGDDERNIGTPRARNPRTDLWISLGILLSIVAAYSSVVHFEFVAYDDIRYVVNNPYLRDGFAARNLHWIFFSFSPDNWFPLTRLSLILDYRLFGVGAGWYHAENVLIHTVAALLLFGFLRRATGDRWPSAFVALVFALHPLHVESVAWVSERKDVLCALFWFATLWAWLRYTEKPTPGRYLATLIWFCLGLMAKPMIVTLPVLLLLLDVWPLRRAASLKTMLRKLPEKIPFAALSAVVMWITMQAQHGALTSVGAPLLRVENALMSVAAYIADTFWPARLWALYAYPVSLPLWQAIVVALSLTAACILVVLQLSKRPYLAVGWFWFLVTLVPVIGVVQVGGQARADRYMYVPMVGLSLMIAWGAAGMVTRWPSVRRTAAGLGMAACLAMAATTWFQTQYWKNTDELFRHAIAMDAGNYLAWNYLGQTAMETGQFPSEAMSCFRTALKIRPDFAVSHNNLGVVLIQQNRVEESIAEYREALRLKPDLTVAHTNLASALNRSGQPLEARNEYQIVLSLDPANESAEISLGTLLANGGDLPEGVSHLENAVAMEPDDKVAQVLLGQMLTQTPGHLSDSITHLREALRIDPKYAKAHDSLAVALLRLHGYDQEAIAHLETAQQIDPNPKRAQQLAALKATGSTGGGRQSDNKEIPH